MATQPLERLKATCALISCPNGLDVTSGTGYLISDFLVATCWHVVETAGPEGILVTFPGSAPRPATVKYSCVDSDVALLELQEAIPIKPFARRAACEQRDQWFAWGYLHADPQGAAVAGDVHDPKVAHSDDGSIVRLQLRSPDFAAAHGQGAHGLSGSPVVVGDAIVGHLVQTRRGKTRGDIPMGHAYACSIDDVEKFLEPEERDSPLPPPPGASHYSSHRYVHRDAVERSAKNALEYGPHVVLRGPYRSGKSMTRRHLLDEISKDRSVGAVIELEIELLATIPPENWFEYLAGRIAGKIGLRAVGKTAKDFEPNLLWTARLTEWMEREVLPELDDKRVILSVEGVRDPSALTAQKQLYKVLRIWAERATSKPWSALRILSTFSTMPTLFNRDPEVSRLAVEPDPIDLWDFDAKQARELARAHGVRWSQEDIRGGLSSLLGGHPYLLAAAMYDARMNGRDLHEVIAAAEVTSRPHLDSLFERLAENHDIIELLQGIFNPGSQNVDLENPLLAKLTAAGILRGDSTRGYEARYGIYRTYFNQRWPIR